MNAGSFDMPRFRVRTERKKFYLEYVEGGMVLKQFIMTRAEWILLARDMLVIASENGAARD